MEFSPRTLVIRRLGAGLLDLFVPPLCLGCSALGGDSPVPGLCRSCWESPWGRDKARCPRCAQVIPSQFSVLSCRACRSRRFPFRSVVTVGDYEGEFREWILRWKFSGESGWTRVFGKLAAARLEGVGRVEGAFKQTPWNCIVPVPLHPAKKRWRGFNQSERLARDLGDRMDLFVNRVRLYRFREARPSSRRTLEARRALARDAFRVRRSPKWLEATPFGLKNAKVLLVDDVMTSGATLIACARALKRHGAKSVDCIVLAVRPWREE